MADTPAPPHFNQPQRRKAEFFRPPNTLKEKVGGGGLTEEILEKAQALLESNAVDFLPLGEMYLNALMRGIEKAQKNVGKEMDDAMIAGMLYPSMQLKANGGMFHYQLVTKIADKLIQFLEVIENADDDALDIVLAFHTTMRAIVISKITGNGGRHGFELMQALDEACSRYFERSEEIPQAKLSGDYSESF